MTLTDEQIRQKFEEEYPMGSNAYYHSNLDVYMPVAKHHIDTACIYNSKYQGYKDGFKAALSLQGEAVPFAYVIPGDDNAKDDGWLDCRVTSEGEFTKPLYDSPPFTTAQQSELTELREMLIAAGEEIQAHWEAHCDEEGYGPNNLLSRIERSLVQSYPGYSVGAFNKIQQDKSELIRKCAELAPDVCAYCSGAGKVRNTFSTAMYIKCPACKGNMISPRQAILALLPEEGKG